MKLTHKILENKVEEKASETEDLRRVVLDALQKLDKMPTSKLSQKLYAKLDGIQRDLDKGSFKG